MVFFDSHGGAWITCSASEEGATAFGPTGVAKSLTSYAMLSLLNSKAQKAFEEEVDPAVAGGRSASMSFFDINEDISGFTTAGEVY